MFEEKIRLRLLWYLTWRLSKRRAGEGGLLIYSQVNSMGHECPLRRPRKVWLLALFCYGVRKELLWFPSFLQYQLCFNFLQILYKFLSWNNKMVRGVAGVGGTFALYRTQKAMTITEEKCGFYKKIHSNCAQDKFISLASKITVSEKWLVAEFTN